MKTSGSGVFVSAGSPATPGKDTPANVFAHINGNTRMGKMYFITILRRCVIVVSITLWPSVFLPPHFGDPRFHFRLDPIRQINMYRHFHRLVRPSSVQPHLVNHPRTSE